MFSTKQKQAFIIWLTILLVIYFVSFGLLVVHKFQFWMLSPFVESQIGVFMSAGAIAIITGIILIFQSSIDSEQKKKQEVFKNKMKLYSRVIEGMNSIRLSGNVDEEDRIKILSLCSEIGLLSNLRTFNEFNEFVNKLADGDGEIEVINYPSRLMKFVSAAREDLEVHGSMTKEEKKQLEESFTKSEEAIKKYARYQKRKFNDISEMIIDLRSKTKISEITEKLLTRVYGYLHEKKLTDEFEFADNFSPSYLGIRRDGKIHLRIRTFQKSINIEHIDGNKWGNQHFFEGVGITIVNMEEEKKDKGLYGIKLEKLDDFEKCKDKLVEYLNLEV